MVGNKKYFNISPRMPWLLMYVFSNIVGTSIMLVTGELIGDSTGGLVYNDVILLWATVLLVFSYIFMLVPAFNFLWRMKVKATQFRMSDDILGKRIGVFLFIIQIGYILFNYLNGVNVAGSIEKTDSSLSVFFVLIPTDALFLIYYGVFRENRCFYPNLLVWIASNLMRGWSGIFLFILFFEWCRVIRNKKIKLFPAVFVLLLLFLIYPVLLNIKMAIRATGVGGLSFNEILSIGTATFSTGDFLSVAADGIFSLVGRIQIASILVEVIRLKDILQSEFMNGGFSPFWLEGLHGVVLDRITGGNSISIAAKFPEYANFPGDYELGQWNTNIGYIGWLFIAPILIPQYIIYTFFLAFLSAFLAKKISNKNSAEDMVWIAWAVYLLAPWLNVFVTFIYALMLFYILKIVFSISLSSISLHPSKNKKMQANV